MPQYDKHRIHIDKHTNCVVDLGFVNNSSRSRSEGTEIINHVGTPDTGKKERPSLHEESHTYAVVVLIFVNVKFYSPTYGYT